MALTPANARVMVVGKDPHVTRILAKLSERDGEFTMLGEVRTLSDAALSQLGPDVVILPASELSALGTIADARLGTLSEREMQVVRLVAEGLSNKEISARLSLSDKTIKNHVSHILAKLRLSARTQVAVHAIKAGLV